MTDATPAFIASRNALAKALHDSGHCDAMFAHYGPARKCERTADRLIASGAVVDAATLADDEELRRVIALETIVAFDVCPPEVQAGYDETAARILRALAAALTERGDA